MTFNLTVRSLIQLQRTLLALKNANKMGQLQIVTIIAQVFILK